MGQQSSRIIWGKSKNPGGNDPGPVGLYQENSYIYCSGNYAIHSTGQGRVAEDYHLYLCTATETGGTWNSEDWKLINGVKNYYLIAHKSFKKGAKVIKEDHNGDFETLKLYSCIVEKTTPNRWIDDEWEVVYQEVGIAWIPRDHKDVYYDDGRNRNKWHKLMWFVPDYYEDQKLDEEIGEFSELQTYHYGERAIHRTLIGEVYCYTYDSNIPRRSEWAAGWWSKDEGVEMYETYKTYYKGDEVIKKNIEAGYQVIQEYQDEMYFEQGKFTLNIIDKEYDVTALAGFHDIVYLERIFGGESIYGLYKSNKTTSGVFNQPDWDLQTSQVIQTRGRDHNMVPIHTDEDTGIICRYCGRFITGYKQKDIKEYQYGAGYEEGELVIWTFDDDIFGLLECQKEIPTVLVPSEYSSDWMPPNEEYWTPIDQFVEQANTLRVFKATKAMDASINTHFIRENWAIVSQKMEPDYDLYGVIWEKYGKPGGGGGIPFGFPLVIQGRSYYDPEGVNYANLDILYPFMGNSCLEIEKTFEAHDWGNPCSGGVSYLTNIVYALYSNESLVRKLMVYSLTGFRELTFTDFTSIQTMSFNNDGIIYYDRLGYRTVNGGIDNRIPYGKFYKSYFGIDNIFGKILLVDIPQESNGNYCWFRPYYSGESGSGWNDPDDDYLYIEQRDDVPLLVSITPIGKLMNVPTANMDLEDTSRYGQCWQDIDLYERHLCYITDDGDIVELEYFKDIHAGISTWSNGKETVTTDEYYANIAMSYIYGGKMLNRTGFDPFPGMYTTYGLHNVEGLNPYSPWFDDDWNLFPDIELVVDDDYYFNIGQVFLLYKNTSVTQQLLSHLQSFCNRYGLDYHTDDMGGGNDMWASARANKYYKFTDEGWYTSSSYPTVQKRGYAYKDRYGNVYILVHKTMKISYYSYDYETNVVSRLHIWSVISDNENKQFYTYFSKYGGPYGSQNNDGELIIIGRHDNYVLAGIRSGSTMSRHLINLKTGTMSEGSFPRYVELPYIGNASSFRIGNTTYTKARIYLGVDWSYYSSGDILPEDEGTYTAVVPFNTYWTPYIANTGGVCHTGDLLTVISVNSSAYMPSKMVVYIPQVMTNTMGIGGFIFLSGQNTNPSYGGPGENGFINK